MEYKRIKELYPKSVAALEEYIKSRVPDLESLPEDVKESINMLTEISISYNIRAVADFFDDREMYGYVIKGGKDWTAVLEVNPEKPILIDYTAYKNRNEVEEALWEEAFKQLEQML